MNELKIFEHPQFGKIRTIVENGKTLFCGADAAKALEYAKPQDAINRHCRYPVKHAGYIGRVGVVRYMGHRTNHYLHNNQR